MSAFRFVDLSHPIEDGMAVFPGLPTPRIGAHLTHDDSRDKYEDAEFFLGKVDMPANVGTYIDSPFHRFKDRADLSQIPLEGIVGLRGVLLDASQGEERELHPKLPEDVPVGAAVLIRTGWDRHWGTESYFGAAPYLAETFANELVERRVVSSVSTLGTSTTPQRDDVRSTPRCWMPASTSSSI